MNKLDILKIIPEALPEHAVEAGYKLLPLLPDDVANYHQLNATWHRDPFYRMLIWQAIQKDITLITKDEDIKKYQSVGLRVI